MPRHQFWSAYSEIDACFHILHYSLFLKTHEALPTRFGLHLLTSVQNSDTTMASRASPGGTICLMRATPWWSARHGAGIGSQFIESRLIHRSTPIEEREEKQNVNRGWCAVERCGGFDAANATFAFAGDNGWLSRIHVWVLLINQAQTPRDDPNNVHRPIALKPKLVVLEEIWMVGM